MGIEKMFDLVEKSRTAAAGDGSSPFSVIPSTRAESTELMRTSHPAISLNEQTLRVATRIRMALAESEKTIAFTGPIPSDSASELAQDVSLAFSQFAPGQVLLVAAGTPSDGQREPGLAELLTGKCGLQSVLIEAEDGGPWVLPAGNMDSDRSHLYFSAECAVLFAALGQRFKHVLVDAGPLSSPASLVMIARCDAVTVALAAGSHHKKEVSDVQKELARIKTRMLGVVLTKTLGREQK